ncbi:MAG: ABC transporter permease [Firmicutes bacterium]|nr:ABC transporter permease [Bacillota bacterium]
MKISWEELSTDQDLVEARPIESPWRQVIRRFCHNRLAVLGLIVLVILCIFSLLTSWIAPHDPAAIDLFNIQSPPSAEHWMGTDDLGRDTLTRLLYGSRITLVVALAATAIGVLVGVVLGGISGYYGGLIETLIMRFIDIMLSFPTLFLLIILSAYMKTTVLGIVSIIGFTSWMGIARLVRGELLALKAKEFVEASHAIGAKDARIIFRHLIPNAMGPVIVAGTLNVGYAILYESSLSFLGVGIQPPAASWGNMLTNAQSYVMNAPWLAFWPGIFIFVTVLCFNFVGDGLRDALDPKLK